MATSSFPAFPWAALRAWCERRAVLLFFALTCAISWPLWLAQPVAAGLDQGAGELLGALALFGPTLAALALAAFLQPSRLPPAPLAPRLAAAGLALGAALLISASRHLHHVGWAFTWSCWALAVLLPASVFILSGAGWRGLRETLGSLTRWRADPNLYLQALFMLAVASLIGIITLSCLGAPWPTFPLAGTLPERAVTLTLGFLGALLYGGLAQEPGWRGFALPRLLRRADPLLASVILSAAWSLWLLPVSLAGAAGTPSEIVNAAAGGLWSRFFLNLPLAVTATWLYNRSRGNLLLVVILHAAAANTVGLWLPPSPVQTISSLLLVLVLAITDRMWEPAPAGGHVWR
jgi:membrane protease YdiL (CAAX protease family)